MNLKLIWGLAIRDLQLRYKGTFLGFLWTLISPLVYLMILVIVFKNAFSDIKNYPLFVVSGIVFWAYFLTATNMIMTTISSNGNILKSIPIPAYLFSLSSLLSAAFNFLISLIPFFIIMLFFGYHLSIHILLLFPLLILYSTFIFSVGLLLGSLNVFFKDVGLLWTALLPALFYATPIAYNLDIVPGKYQSILKLNPLAHFLDVFRSILYFNELPSLKIVTTLIISTTILLLISIWVYRKLEKGFISAL